MRHNSRRPKNKNSNSKKSPRTQVYDSNGPDVRIRGTAHQVLEKYLALAKDARGSGDYIMAENYLQHAEHYQRIINSFNDEASDRSQAKQQRQPKEQVEANNQKSEDDDLGLPASMLKPATTDEKQAVKEDA